MKKIAFILVFITILLAKPAFAKTYEIMFWYPGGPGTTEEAAPYLDAFAGYISEQMKGTSFKAIYINNEKLGWKYIKDNKPAFAIISYPMWIKGRTKLKGTPFLQCLPTPNGKSTEKYMLISNAFTPHDIYSSFPMTDIFAEMAFQNLPKTIPYKTTKRVLSILRKMARKERVWAMLTPDEGRSIKAMNSDWVDMLKIVESNPVQTAPVVALDKNISFITDLKKILKAMGKSRKQGVKDILTELRLKGFTDFSK